MSDNSHRREPQQSRSQELVDRLLDGAATLFAEVGYEAATTNAIAEKAGVSIGSLYRYFPDRKALLAALADRHVRQLRALHDRVFTPDVVYLPLPVLLDRLIDPFVELHMECPAFAHLLLGSDTSADIAEVTCELDGEIVERLAGVFRQLAPALDAARARLVASVSKAAVKALMSGVAAERHPGARAALVAETKKMLLAYLRSIVEVGP
jgi:AcrR family transcriptional regulator